MKRIVTIGVAALVTFCVVWPAMREQSTALAAGASALTPTQEKRAAFAAIQRLRTAKTLPEISNALTNNSAAQVGTIDAAAMAYLSEAWTSPTGKSIDPTFEKDLSAYISGYGLSLEMIANGRILNRLPYSVNSRGHVFLTGLAPFDVRLNKIDPGAGGPPVSSLPASSTGYHMTVINDHTVKIAMVKPNGDWPSILYAREESGSWIIDVGDLAE